MAFIRLEDTTGSMEMIVFPKVLTGCSEKLVERKVIIVKGRVSIREEETPKLIADSVLLPKEAESGKTAGSSRKGFFLRVPGESNAILKKVENLLSVFEGRESVYFYYEDTKQYKQADQTLWIQYDKVLERELKKLLGEANVVYRK